MDYFSILNLNREPFSNSPDPDYFFNSEQHLGCLQKLELSIRLKRGLNVVVGDVGTGKTTLCRQLIRRFAGDQACETHLILDPSFSTPAEFLATVAEMLTNEKTPADANEWQVKETIKQVIFRKGVDEKKTVVVIIDEGQKIPEFCLEILREFLNFETNEFKLLQIVIFAQREFENFLETHANLSDRINLFHLLEPLNIRDTLKMIQFRINQSSAGAKPPSLFSYPALWQVFRETGGYPRKIVNLCHRIILAMIIQNRTKAGRSLVVSCARRGMSGSTFSWRPVLITAALVLVTASLAVGLAPEKFGLPLKWSLASGPKPVQPEPAIPAELPAAPSIEAQTASPGIEKKDDKLIPPAPQQTQKALATPDVAMVSATRPETAGDERDFPPTLGQVALKRNETLWRLIEKVYGVFDERYLESIRQANPLIVNPERLKVGQPITIPAIPARVKPGPSPVWWVKVDERERLNDAIEILRTYPAGAPPIRLVPYWNGSALKVAILLREHFDSEAEADRQLEQLSGGTASKAMVISSWGEHVVFFSDPYVKPRR